MKIQKIATLLLCLALLAGLVGCGSPSSTTSEAVSQTPGSEAQSSTPAADVDLLSGTIEIEIVIQDYGTITADLDADTAPVTVTNFVSLAEAGFYDGLTFHRIIDGFMMQGGDPNGNGSGGSGTNIVGEFAANNISNSIRHERGVLSMARSNAGYDTASSQFFIMHADSAGLNGSYAAFGYVTDGMDVVDAVVADARPTDGNGTIPADEQPVIETIRVLSK